MRCVLYLYLGICKLSNTIYSLLHNIDARYGPLIPESKLSWISLNCEVLNDSEKYVFAEDISKTICTITRQGKFNILQF